MAERVVRQGDTVMLYDASRVGQIDPAWFDHARWPRADAAPGPSGGRGRTLFIRAADQDWVLRHYHRGGLFAGLLGDRYPWLGADASRAFREWRLLARLRAVGLPVPAPVAARCVRSGLVCRQDLITVRLPGVEPLSLRLTAGPLGEALWRAVGRLVARFHAAGVRHADLNAHNVQVGADDELFLLDFDRGQLMPEAGGWCEANLRRLERSLDKISRTDGAVLEAEATQWLRAGYADARRDAA